MTPQTLTIREAETQLRSWLNTVQTSQQSVILTADDATEPLALLMPVLNSATNRYQAMIRHVELLESVVPLWQKALLEGASSREFAHLCHSQLRILAEIIPEDLSIFASAVMLLRLTVRTLADEASADHLTAFRHALLILKKIDLTVDDLTQIDQILLDAGLDIQAELGDSDLLKAYVDVL